MKNKSRYIALETRTMAAAAATIRHERLYTLVTGRFLHSLTREEAFTAAECLLQQIEQNLAIESHRLIGRMILASSCEDYSERTFDGFSLAFRSHNIHEIEDAISSISASVYSTIVLNSGKLSNDFHVYDVQGYMPTLKQMEAAQIEAGEEAEYEDCETPLLYFGGQLEWYFFRDQSFDRSHLGCVGTALGAFIPRADTFAIPG